MRKLSMPAAFLVLLLVSGGYVANLRRCHANVFAGRGHANWKVAFEGDSLTQFWRLPATNFGMWGQTSGEIRSRFAKDVLCHCYNTVVLLAGTNDAIRTIPASSTLINLEAMVVAAQSHHMRVLIGTIPPLGGKFADLNTTLHETNVGIIAIARRRRIGVIDYNAELTAHPEDFFDGVHLTDEGYARMKLALEKAKSVN